MAELLLALAVRWAMYALTVYILISVLAIGLVVLTMVVMLALAAIHVVWEWVRRGWWK